MFKKIEFERVNHDIVARVGCKIKVRVATLNIKFSGLFEINWVRQEILAVKLHLEQEAKPSPQTVMFQQMF